MCFLSTEQVWDPSGRWSFFPRDSQILSLLLRHRTRLLPLGDRCLALSGALWASHLIPAPPPLPLKGILRTGLEEVKQFFALNGSCRLPLSPSLLVKGIVPRVSLC